MSGLSPLLFAGTEPVGRDVTLANGSTHRLYFKQLPASEFRRYFMATQHKDDAVQAEAMARLISASLCDEQGKPAISVKQAMQLTPAADRAISEAVLSVNGLDNKAGNELPQVENSGSGTS